jgi:uncharacterized protein
MAHVPIAEGLFSGSEAEPCLLGSRCTACGAFTFPVQDGCPRCAATAMDQVGLASEGTIWTWTSQEFLPPAPPYAGPETIDTFQPYYVGFVELDGQLRVESRLVNFGDEPPRIGQRVEMVLMPYGTQKEGNEVMTYAFVPTKVEPG